MPHPAGTGGGMLSFLLSLDSSAAALNFKSSSVEEKLAQWNKHLSVMQSSSNRNAHPYDFVHISSENYINNIETADYCSTYVHKGMFYEFENYRVNFQNTLFDRSEGELLSVGIYLTSECVEKMRIVRPYYFDDINYYQRWVYSNQVKLMKDLFNVNTVHHFAFSDMLDENLFVEHVQYCKDILQLDIDMDTVCSLIKEWHSNILKI